MCCPSLLLKALSIGLDDPRFARLKQSLWLGDLLADAVAAWIHANKGGWQLFQQALKPESLGFIPTIAGQAVVRYGVA